MGCSSSSSNFTRASSSKFLDTTIEWLMCNIFPLGVKTIHHNSMIVSSSHIPSLKAMWWLFSGLHDMSDFLGCSQNLTSRRSLLLQFSSSAYSSRGRDHGSQTLAHVVFHLFPIVTLLSPGPSLSPRHLLT